MILVIDNYDSFTYNLVQIAAQFEEIKVVRNNKITLETVDRLNPDYIIISPGPGRPSDAGISRQVIWHFKSRSFILGVCLGHQCIAEVFGASIIRAPRMFHGKTSLIYLNKGKYPLFRGIESPFSATRYHSLLVASDSLPQHLEVTAETADGEIMAIRHRQYPVYGVQFHPESILTKSGELLIKNFIDMGRGKHAKQLSNKTGK